MSAGRPLFISLGGAPPVAVHIHWDGPSGRYRAVVDGQTIELDVERHDQDGTLHVRVDDELLRVRVEHDNEGVPHLAFVDDPGAPVLPVRSTAADHLALQAQRPPPTVSAGPLISAPIAGEILCLAVAAGDRVHRDAPLLRLEAMKMEVEVRSHAPGIIARVHVAPGDRVRVGAPLVELDLSGVVLLR
ncbi:MAG: acetyl-CoA carboxylase biotin carboxyl carrier protein subunit [Deltaproteobacteria bacterium]|nr:MAG: acetyl-CoA carboxylase biotin carboxyl carrier protein subunit [Deltaproteobacteria bacterium]